MDGSNPLIYNVDCHSSNFKVEPLDIESNDSNDDMNNGSTKRGTKRGWMTSLFAVCSISLAVAILSVATRLSSHIWTVRQVRKWTIAGSTTTNSLSIVEIARKDMEQFQNDARFFFSLLQMPDTVLYDFTASDTNLNALASSIPVLRGKTYITLETKNHVSIDVRFPADRFPGGEGRYLVGNAIIKWIPGSSVLHTTMYALQQEGVRKEPLFEARFRLNCLPDGTTRSLELLDGHFMGWMSPPKELINTRLNLLGFLYDCREGNDDESCMQARNVLDGLHRIFLEKGKIVFRAHSKERKLDNSNGGNGKANEKLLSFQNWLEITFEMLARRSSKLLTPSIQSAVFSTTV